MLISLHLWGADAHNFVSSEGIRVEQYYRCIRNNSFLQRYLFLQYFRLMFITNECNAVCTSLRWMLIYFCENMSLFNSYFRLIALSYSALSISIGNDKLQNGQQKRLNVVKEPSQSE